MQDNPNYSYISTIITLDETTHYIKDSEARTAITNLETSKQDKITSSNKLPASKVSGLATVATSGSYNDLSNKPTIPEGVIVDTAMSASSTNAVQNKIIKQYVDDSIASSVASLFDFKGSKDSLAAIQAITTAKKGDVWEDSSTGQEYYASASITTATASVWKELGKIVDLSGYAKTEDLGNLAYKNSASGTFTPSGSVSINAYTPEGSVTMDEYTPAGSLSMNNFTPAGIIGTDTGTPNYTPSGSLSMNNFTPSGTISSDTGTANYTPSGNISMDNFTPVGTVSTPTITVTPSTTTVPVMSSTGSLPSLEMSVENETLSLTFSAGTLPSVTNREVVSGIQSATSSQPTFTGTAAKPTGSFSGTGVNLKFTGTSDKPTGSFSGDGVYLKFTGTAAKPSGSFSGTKATLTGSFSGTAKAPTGSFSGTQGNVTVS